MKNFTFIISFLLAACSSGSQLEPQVSSKPHSVEQSLQKDYEESRMLLASYNAQFACDTIESKQLVKDIEYLEHLHSVYQQRLRFKDNSVLEKQQLVRRQFTELGFGFAESAMQKGCTKQALNTYKQLYTFYQNTQFKILRKRALVGVNQAKKK